MAEPEEADRTTSMPQPPFPSLTSRRATRETWSQLLALHLDARRNWREMGGAGGDLSPNEVDIFLVGLLARFAGAGRVLVDEAELARRLDHCRTDPNLVFAALAGEAPGKEDVVLFSIAGTSRAGELALAAPDALVLIYGAGRSWQHGPAAGTAGVASRPLSGTSPALWKASLALLVPVAKCAERDHLLAATMDVLADRTLDPFFLLDQVQDLRAAARRPEGAPEDAHQLKARIAELEHEVANLRRFAMIQQENIKLLHAPAGGS